MLREGFENDFQIEREAFVSFILGSLGLSSTQKHTICQDWKSIEDSEIIKYIQDLKNEKDRFDISSELYDELSEALAHGIIDNREDIEYLIKLSNDKCKKDWSVFYALGTVYGKKGVYNNSIEAYQKSIEINPKNNNVYYNIGVTYGNKEEYNKAIEAYKKAIEINSKDDKAHTNMGIAYYEKGEYDHAIEAYKKAIEINSKDDEAYVKMGIAYGKKEEYLKEIEAYKKAVEINPKDYKVYYLIGIIYHLLGKFDEVIKALSMALHINPNNSLAYTNLFELQLTQNQPFDQALEKKYIELFQNKKESFIHYEMLKILQDISHKKEVNLEQWKEKYEGIELGWSFDELESWIDGVEESDLKVRLREALGGFKGFS